MNSLPRKLLQSPVQRNDSWSLPARGTCAFHERINNILIKLSTYSKYVILLRSELVHFQPTLIPVPRDMFHLLGPREWFFPLSAPPTPVSLSPCSLVSRILYYFATIRHTLASLRYNCHFMRETGPPRVFPFRAVRHV